MCPKKLSLKNFDIHTLDKELIARGAEESWAIRFNFDTTGTYAREEMIDRLKEIYDQQNVPSINPELEPFTFEQIIKVMHRKIDILQKGRGLRGEDDRRDYNQIKDSRIKKNADSVAMICLKDNLIDKGNGFMEIRTQNYGKTFYLSGSEPFFDQPVLKGYPATGFLIGEDRIATAGHVVCDNRKENLRFVFGFRKKSKKKIITEIPVNDVYCAESVIFSQCKRSGNFSDWAVIKLDRKVTGHAFSVLSDEKINFDQPVYVMGYPWGLPLKYAPGATVQGIMDAFLVADLDVYCGNSGSPVYSTSTNKVVGIVVRGDNKDFRWDGNGYRSFVYPQAFKRGIPDGAECTLASEIIGHMK